MTFGISHWRVSTASQYVYMFSLYVISMVSEDRVEVPTTSNQDHMGVPVADNKDHVRGSHGRQLRPREFSSGTWYKTLEGFHDILICLYAWLMWFMQLYCS